MSSRITPFLPAIFISIILVCVGIYIDQLNIDSEKTKRQQTIFSQLSVVRAKLEGHINSHAQTIKGLVINIGLEPALSQDRFASLSSPLIGNNTMLRNIAAAPNLVIRYMHPIKGNEQAIGLDYRSLKDQYAAIKRTIDAKQLTIAGPVNLVQGGVGFIARYPIYIEKDHKKEFWGLVSAVLDSEQLYRGSGLYDLNNLSVAIRGKDGSGERGEVFYGDEKVFTTSPVKMDVTLPYGNWQLAAIPEHGWESVSPEILQFRVTMIGVTILLAFTLFFLTRLLQKKRESETLLRGLFELSPFGIALNELETGHFVEINDALVAPGGYTKEEFTSLSYWDITPKSYEKQEAEQIESLQKTGRYGPYEKEYIRKDGSRYPVLLNGMRVKDRYGKQLIWSIVEDISERKRMEKIKDEFISTVSHELRTPLTSIQGTLQLIVGGAVGEITGKTEEMVTIALNNTARLSHIINDLLDMEKLSQGKMVFYMEVCSLEEQLEEAVMVNQAYAQQHGVNISLQVPDKRIIVRFDKQRMQQVMANLLSNAVKFSPKNSVVLIKVELDSDRVRVNVIDKGPGIAEELRDKIFEKFTQADSSDARSTGGTGLGLTITREIIEQMDGSISLDTEPGKGTTFYFELPVIND